MQVCPIPSEATLGNNALYEFHSEEYADSSVQIHPSWCSMEYRNTEIKLETLVTYFNEERVNLNPVFQRGSVWKIGDRRELIKNVVLGRPIPAIFVYKDEAGSKYVFNILDGKQRLESILLFIGSARADFKISTWAKYIPIGELREQVAFAAPLGAKKGKLLTLAQLDETVIRELREYPIPMIEITLNEATSIDEIISLFVDINQRGVKVTRLQIVRALKRNDRFLKDVYGLIAIKQKRAQAAFARRKRTDFVYVLKRLQVVANIYDPDQQADRMWERLFEIALFVRSGKHRKPTEILKSFIKAPDVLQDRLSAEERGRLSRAFDFLAWAYKHTGLEKTRFATDQTHFYTMVTAILGKNLLSLYQQQDLADALCDFNDALDRRSSQIPGMSKIVREYKAQSAKQTSDSTRREEREKDLLAAIALLVSRKGARGGSLESAPPPTPLSILMS